MHKRVWLFMVACKSVKEPLQENFLISDFRLK